MDDKSGSDFHLPVQPIIELTYSNNKSTIWNKRIEIFVYKWIDTENTLKTTIISGNSSIKSASSLISQIKSNRSGLSGDSAMETVRNMWSLITSSGKLVKELKEDYVKVKIEFTYPQETSDFKLRFKDLKILFKEFGKYQLLFKVDGIESSLSDVITVEQTESKDSDMVIKLD